MDVPVTEPRARLSEWLDRVRGGEEVVVTDRGVGRRPGGRRPGPPPAAATSTYRLHAVHRSVLDLEQPVLLKLPLSDLVIG